MLRENRNILEPIIPITFITKALRREIMHRSQLCNKFLREREKERERERERERETERERELWHKQLSCINHEELLFFILISPGVLCLNKKLSVNKHLKQEYFSKFL